MAEIQGTVLCSRVRPPFPGCSSAPVKLWWKC